MSVLLSAGLSSIAHGHALDPGYLELRQIDESLYAVSWKKPAIEGAPMAIAVRLPEQCDIRTEGQLTWDGVAYYSRWTTTCAGGLVGGELQIEGLENTSTDVLVRFDLADGLISRPDARPRRHVGVTELWAVPESSECIASLVVKDLHG